MILAIDTRLRSSMTITWFVTQLVNLMILDIDTRLRSSMTITWSVIQLVNLMILAIDTRLRNYMTITWSMTQLVIHDSKYNLKNQIKEQIKSWNSMVIRDPS